MRTHGRDHLRAAVVTALGATVVLVAAAPASAATATCAGLGAAITAANVTPGGEVIDLPAGATCRIGAALPVVTDTLTIDGHGARLRPAAGTSTILLDADGEDAAGPLTLTVANLTMSGATDAIFANTANVVVDHSLLRDNQSGVYAIRGSVDVRSSRIAHNGGGLFGDFAFATDSELVDNGVAVEGAFGAGVLRSVVRRNTTGVTAPEGATAYQSTIDRNGTGLASRDSIELGSSRLTGNGTGLTGGQRRITDSTVARNADVGASQFETTVSGSVFLDNTHGLEADGGARISNSTFAHGDELFVRGGSVDFTTITGTLHSDQAMDLTNSIVLACDGVFAEDGVPSSSSGNVSPDTDCPGRAATADPRLRGLSDNGGPTRTLALGAASPARDLIACGPSTDQRGFPRPSGPACDAGAFEAQVSAG